jgi:ubiquinol-cytochrome c reductase iron-sulfur subunit
MSQDTTQPGAGAVDPSLPPDPSRRKWVATTCTLGGVAGVATIIPFASSFAPSERAKAAGAPVEVDISAIAPGEMHTVAWRGKPVWVLHSTPDQIKNLSKNDPYLADPKSQNVDYTPAFAQNEYRSRKPEYLVVVGICTHLGCSPNPLFAPGPQPGVPNTWEGGFLCPCHGSYYDLAGRVYKNVPAPDNLLVPPYMFSKDGRLLTIGVDEETKA